MLEKDLPIVGSDFDGVVVRDIQTMSAVLQKNFIIPDSEFWTYRRNFLREPRYIDTLRPSPGVFTAIPIIANYSSKLLMISARQEFLREPIEKFLEKYNRLQYYSGIILRSGDETPLESKLENVKEAAVSYMIEDDPEIAIALAKAGISVLFIDGMLNNGMVNTPQIRIYEGMWDVAWDLVREGSFQNIFNHHQMDLPNLTDPRVVHRISPPCTDKGTVCKKLLVCFPSSKYFEKDNPYQAVAV